jgi:hypothetical protein
MLALYNAYRGKMDQGYAFAGSNAWRSTKIMSVQALMDELSSEYTAYEQALA